MSSLRSLCCLLLVKKQKHEFHSFKCTCIIKQLFDSVFVISRIMKVLVRVRITPASTLIILDITKTSFNCL